MLKSSWLYFLWTHCSIVQTVVFTDRKVLRGWRRARWMRSLNTPAEFVTLRHRRRLEITTDGIYLIYAQVRRYTCTLFRMFIYRWMHNISLWLFIPNYMPKIHCVCLNKNLAIANRSRVSCAHNKYAEGIYDNPVILKSRLTRHSRSL